MTQIARYWRWLVTEFHDRTLTLLIASFKVQDKFLISHKLTCWLDETVKSAGKLIKLWWSLILNSLQRFTKTSKDQKTMWSFCWFNYRRRLCCITRCLAAFGVKSLCTEYKLPRSSLMNTSHRRMMASIQFIVFDDRTGEFTHSDLVRRWHLTCKQNYKQEKKNKVNETEPLD